MEARRSRSTGWLSKWPAPVSVVSDVQVASLYDAMANAATIEADLSINHVATGGAGLPDRLQASGVIWTLSVEEAHKNFALTSVPSRYDRTSWRAAADELSRTGGSLPECSLGSRLFKFHWFYKQNQAWRKLPK